MPEAKEIVADLPTPILESAALPPRIQQIKLSGVATGFLIGMIPGVAAVTMVLIGKQGDDPLPTRLLSFVSVLVLATIVHEMGHLIAGWTVGFRFSSIQIGPLSLRIVHGKLKIRFRREMTAFGYAGMHVNRLRRLRRRMVIFFAAGTAANWLSVVAIVFLMHTFPLLVNTWVSIPAVQFAFASFVLGALSLVPFAITVTSSSDGSRIAMLLGSRERTRRWLSILALQHVHDQGIRAKLWKKSWLRAATSLKDPSRDTFRANLLAYMSANGREDAPVAAHHLEKCLELAAMLPISMRDGLAQEAAVFAAWFRNDASLADKWFRQLTKPKSLPRLAEIRVRTAMYCARRDFDLALGGWHEGLALIERTTAGTPQKLLRESWFDWQAKIMARQAQPPVMEGRYTARASLITT